MYIFREIFPVNEKGNYQKGSKGDYTLCPAKLAYSQY